MADLGSIPIIDSHIHLYPEEDLGSLNWCTPEHPLSGRHSVEEYKKAAALPSKLRGFVFVETDRKNGDGSNWEQPLEEIKWLRRIAEGTPLPNQGHTAADAKMVLAIVPWAPLLQGPAKVEEYLVAAQKAAGETWPKVKGFRQLLQFAPNGTMLGDDFIASLKLLGRKGYVFEVGVDQHRRGRIQLEETVDMIDRAHDGVPEEEKVVFVLGQLTGAHMTKWLANSCVDHFLKPDLAIINQTDPSFRLWRDTIFTLSQCKQTYIKLSGAFSEMPHSLAQRDAEDIFMALYPWLAILLAAFGPSRIMFGSDWPPCTVGLGDGAWLKWQKVVARMCYSKFTDIHLSWYPQLSMLFC
jgi:L-rhamnono-1,4-lactonase